MQRLIREARADPENWTERTPGEGGLAQLGVVERGIGLASAAAILAVYAWWLIPLLVLPRWRTSS